MNPEDIQHRDFLVGMRGYDKDDVRSFLAEVAAEYAQLQRELDAQQAAGTQPAPASAPAADDFENLGAGIAAILRAAKGSAAELNDEAEVRAQLVREEADTYAATLRHQAEDIRANAEDAAGDMRARAEAQAEELRAAAQASLDTAQAEAERILRDASDRAHAIEIETEARLRTSVESILADAEDRIASATQRETALRDRLSEASDELQLTLMALGDGIDGEAMLADLREQSDVPVEPGDAPAWS